MKKVILFSLIVLLSACAKGTKQVATNFYWAYPYQIIEQSENGFTALGDICAAPGVLNADGETYRCPAWQKNVAFMINLATCEGKLENGVVDDEKFVWYGDVEQRKTYNYTNALGAQRTVHFYYGTCTKEPHYKEQECFVSILDPTCHEKTEKDSNNDTKDKSSK